MHLSRNDPIQPLLSARCDMTAQEQTEMADSAELSSSAPELMTREQAATYLGLSPRTLAVWASTGRCDLPMLKLGACVRYRKTDLDEWLNSRIVTQSHRPKKKTINKKPRRPKAAKSKSSRCPF
jgi:excisionase family DNA binding protein